MDDEQIATEAMLVVVGNSRSYGGGMRVFPDASIDDGVLDVCIVHALSKAAFLRAFPRVFRGTHVRHPKVTMLRGRRVTVEANRRIQVLRATASGSGRSRRSSRSDPGALRLVVGPDATAVR